MGGGEAEGVSVVDDDRGHLYLRGTSVESAGRGVRSGRGGGGDLRITAYLMRKKRILMRMSGRDEIKHTEDTLRNVDARSEGDTAGTMTVGERGGSVTRSYRK